MGTYEDKKAELVAVAQGGSAGRQAYQEGRQRIVSDQRAALDAALAGPVQFGTGTAAALEGIIRPTQETGLARMDVAGDRHGASMGALDAALSGALTQQGGARSLNYSETLRLGRQNTDRNIEMQEIARQKAAEDAAAAAAAGGDLSEGERMRQALGLGEVMHTEATTALRAQQRQATIDELNAIAREAFSSLPDKRQVSLMMELRENADNPEAIRDMIERYSPTDAPKAQGALARGFDAVRNVGRVASGQDSVYRAPPARSPSDLRAIDAALNGYITGAEVRGQDERKLETERYLANRDAYVQLFGDPLQAMGVFPEDPGFSTLDDQSATQEYITSGLRGEELEEADDEMLRSIAASAGLSDTLVNKVIDTLPVEATEVYKMMRQPDMAQTIADAVSAAVSTARSSPEEDLLGNKIDRREVAASVAARAVQENVEGDPAYIEALALIAAEQARVYAKVQPQPAEVEDEDN